MAHRGSPKFAKYARGSFATKAYLAHFSIREIAELLAWSEDKVERIINRYRSRLIPLRCASGVGVLRAVNGFDRVRHGYE
jgi:hypothetical protein